jgi:hypothetical protein
VSKLIFLLLDSLFLLKKFKILILKFCWIFILKNKLNTHWFKLEMFHLKRIPQKKNIVWVIDTKIWIQ